MKYQNSILLLLALSVAVAAPAFADGAAVDRAAWLLDRADPGEASLQLASLPQIDVGGVTAPASDVRSDSQGGGRILPLAMSVVLPGLGEAYLGHKRGYLMMAADIAAWAGVKHYHDKGNDIKDEYLAFADAHWSETRLDNSFDIINFDPAWGNFYFGVTDMEDLPLWVSKEDDYREYYENLGKWDQFVFGWDDFISPVDLGYANVGGEVGAAYLKDPRVSLRRESYRALRRDSNDQFTNRDNLMYFNLLLRLFSLFQVAYLQGMLGGGDSGPKLEAGGVDVGIFAEPMGLTASRVGVKVSY